MSELVTPIAIASVLAINLLLLAVWHARWNWAVKCQSVCNSAIRKAAAACAVTALVLVAWFYATLPDPLVRTSLRANVERFQFQVVAPVNASQRVSGMRLRTIGEEEGRCVDGVIQPQAGAFVEFVRTAQGQTGIRVEFRDKRDDDGKTTVAVLLAANKEPERIVGGIDLSPDTGHCPGRPPDRFAIDGVAEFGHEFRAADLGRDPAAGYLSEGWISMFITGIDRILFWPLSPRLIQVESVLLPAGSRVQAAPPKTVAKNEDSRARWIGVATADTQQRSFVVDASTNARVIEIRLSGAERERSELRVSDFTRATQDGNILWFYTSVVAIWGAAVAVLSDVAKKWLTTRLGLEPKEMPSSTVPRVSPSLRKPIRSRPRGTLKLLLLTFALAGMPFDGSAAPVRLTAGEHFGQGWMFTDHAGVCRIVTAAHVVQRGGKLVAPVAADGSGRELLTTNPVQPDPNLDIAILTARPAGACPVEGLGEATAAQRIDQSPRPTLDFLGRTARGSVHLVRRARSVDADGGRTLVFDRAEGPQISQGMSGGAILDGSGRPIAIITHTDAEENRANGVRVDVIATLIKTRLSQPPEAGAAQAVVGWSVLHGASVDPDGSVDQILEDRGWSVAPLQGFVTIDARFGNSRSLRSVSFRINDEARGQIRHLQIFGDTRPPRPDMPPLGSCVPAPGAADLHCEFAPRPIQSFRLQMGISASPVTLSHLRLGFAD